MMRRRRAGGDAGKHLRHTSRCTGWRITPSRNRSKTRL